jgi:hypothetical protein
MRETVIVTVILAAMSTAVLAGANPAAKVAVHVEAYASRSCTKAATMPVINTCANIQYTYAGYNVDAFPVFFDMTEYQGFDYGMTWEGGVSGVFTSCSDLTIGGIANSGDGIAHAWYTCRPSWVAIPGWLWRYSYGLIWVVEHPDAGGIVIGDCATPAGKDTLDPIVDGYCAGTHGKEGCDPCWFP